MRAIIIEDKDAKALYALHYNAVDLAKKMVANANYDLNLLGSNFGTNDNFVNALAQVIVDGGITLDGQHNYYKNNTARGLVYLLRTSISHCKRYSCIRGRSYS